MLPFLYSRETYSKLVSWLTDAQKLASSSLSIVVVGNKLDLKEDREVTFLEASRFALENSELSCDRGCGDGDDVRMSQVHDSWRVVSESFLH